MGSTLPRPFHSIHIVCHRDVFSWSVSSPLLFPFHQRYYGLAPYNAGKQEALFAFALAARMIGSSGPALKSDAAAYVVRRTTHDARMHNNQCDHALGWQVRRAFNPPHHMSGRWIRCMGRNFPVCVQRGEGRDRRVDVAGSTWRRRL